MDNRKTPTWLKVVLGILALVFLGPPLLALTLGAVGTLLALTVALFKVGVVVGLVWLGWRALKALFGGSPGGDQRGGGLPAAASVVEMEPLDTQLEREDRERKAELDRELDRALRAKAGLQPPRPSV